MLGTVSLYEILPDGSERPACRSRNLITAAGLAYYAQRMGGGTPAAFVDGSGDFDGVIVLASAFASTPNATSVYSVLTPIAASIGAPTSGYPLTGDTGTNHESSATLAPLTGSTDKLDQCVTFTKVYAAGVLGVVQVRGAVITDPSPTASSPLLAVTLFSPAQVTSASSGYRFVWNHFLQGTST